MARPKRTPRSAGGVPFRTCRTGSRFRSFVAELAAAAGKDQKEFLLDLIGPARILDVPQKVKGFWDYGENPEVYPIDTGRLRNVVELVTEKGGLGKRELPKGHGLGLAVHRSFVSYVAAVIEAAVDEKGNVTVPRVDIAVDCGPIVNPDRVRSQFEGAVIMGLGVGLAERDLVQGRPRSSRAISTTTTCCGSATRRVRRMSISCRTATTCLSAASASPACRRSRLRS